MTYYADSSFLVAFHVPHDTFHKEATAFYEPLQEEVWLWSPWHRVEVFNTIRQLTRNPDAKRAINPAEGRALIVHIEGEVRGGYLSHVEADWRDVLRSANELSLAFAATMPCRASDLLHVAYAQELSAEALVSFDDDQLNLAKAAGMKSICPGRKSR